jgi:hypothetical protein
MTVDLSPAAINARLRLASDLRDLCQAIANRLPPNAMEQKRKEEEIKRIGNLNHGGTEAQRHGGTEKMRNT